MKEAVASNREVVMELEEHPGMVELRIRLEKSTDQLGKFFLALFFFMILGLSANCCRRKTPDATSALCARHNVVIDRIRGSFHISAYEICKSFSPAITSLVSFSRYTWRESITDAGEGDGQGKRRGVAVFCGVMESSEETLLDEGGISYFFI